MAGLIRRVARAIRNRPDPEQRDAGGYAPGVGIGGVGGFATPGAGAIGAMAAENIATITAAVQLVASTIGSLPAFVYRQEGMGRSEAPGHPVARLIRAPNDHQTGPDFFEWLTAQFLLFGNALALIEADGNGQATSLVPIPWPHVCPVLLPDNRLAFDVVQMGPWGGTGLPRRVLDTECLHVRDRSDDGYLGRSRLSRAPQVIQAALGLAEFSAAIWQNSANLAGAIVHPGKLNPEAMKFISEEFNRNFSGAANSKKTVVLSEGMSFIPFSVSPEDAQVLESRRFSTEDCARLMGVPPPLVGIWDHSSFTNSATASSWMGTFTILPIVRKIEAAFGRSVFADPFGPFHLELDMSALMRGDASQQQAANVANVGAGIMTADEARHDLGLNPLPAGAAPLSGELPGTDP